MELCARGFSVAPKPYYRTTNHSLYSNTAQIGGAGSNVQVGIYSSLNTDNGSLSVVSRVWTATDPFGINIGTGSITPTNLGNDEFVILEMRLSGGSGNHEYYIIKEIVSYSDGSTSETASFYRFIDDGNFVLDSNIALQSVKIPNPNDILDNSQYIDMVGTVSNPFTTSELDITQPNDFIYDVSQAYGSVFTVSPTSSNYSANISNDQLLGVMYQRIIFNI